MRISGLVFLFLLLFLSVPAYAFECMSENDCPNCNIDGATLTKSSVSAFSDKEVLTCEYGGDGKKVGDVFLVITCYEDAGTARQWTDYYAGNAENPDKSPAAGLYSRIRWRCVSSGSTQKSTETVTESFECNDYAGTGKFVAVINAEGMAAWSESDPAAVQTQKTSAAQDLVKARIQEYKDCFAGFSPQPAPAQQQSAAESKDILRALSEGVMLNGNRAEPYKPLALKTGDRITTSSGGYGHILLQGGERIRLDTSSDVIFSPEELQLKIGGVWYLAEKRGQGFIIRTPMSVTSIPGTVLVVSADSSGKTTIRVISGSVTVTDSENRGSVAVSSGQETVVAGGSPPSAPVPAGIPSNGEWWERAEYTDESVAPSPGATRSPAGIPVIILGMIGACLLALSGKKSG